MCSRHELKSHVKLIRTLRRGVRRGVTARLIAKKNEVGMGNMQRKGSSHGRRWSPL
jgi:hypothetical protein